MYLADIKRDDRFEGYLIVRSAEQRASANGKNYLDMTLADKSGSINAKMWDGTVQPPLAGSIVKVRATGKDREEMKRMTDIFRARIVDVTDTTYVIELTGNQGKLDAFIQAIDPALILEAVRSGVCGIGRGERVLRA